MDWLFFLCPQVKPEEKKLVLEILKEVLRIKLKGDDKILDLITDATAFFSV